MGVQHSSDYHRSEKQENRSDELLMQLIDRIYLDEPTFGSRRMVDALNELGYKVHRDRVCRLMRKMGIEAIYPRPRLSQPGKGHKRYPCYASWI
jgi:putative transposase